MNSPKNKEHALGEMPEIALKHCLKNWASHLQIPEDARSRLLKKASQNTLTRKAGKMLVFKALWLAAPWFSLPMSTSSFQENHLHQSYLLTNSVFQTLQSEHLRMRFIY